MTEGSGLSSTTKLNLVAVFILAVFVAGSWATYSELREVGSASGIVIAAAAGILGFAAAAWVFRHEGRRTSEQIRSGNGGALSSRAGQMLGALFIPLVFVADDLPDAVALAGFALLSSFLLGGAIALPILARKWQRMGF